MVSSEPASGWFVFSSTKLGLMGNRMHSLTRFFRAWECKRKKQSGKGTGTRTGAGNLVGVGGLLKVAPAHEEERQSKESVDIPHVAIPLKGQFSIFRKKEKHEGKEE